MGLCIRSLGLVAAVCAFNGASCPAGELAAAVARTTELEGIAVQDRILAIDLQIEHELALGALTFAGDVAFEHDLHELEPDDVEIQRSGQVRVAWERTGAHVHAAVARLIERFPHDPTDHEDEQTIRLAMGASVASWTVALDVEHVRERFPNDPDDDEDEREAELELGWAFESGAWEGTLSQTLFREWFAPSADDDERRLEWDVSLERTFQRTEFDLDGSLALRTFPRDRERNRVQHALAASGHWRATDALELGAGMAHQRRRLPHDPEDDRDQREMTLTATWERPGFASELSCAYQARRFPHDPDEDRTRTTTALEAEWERGPQDISVAYERETRRYPHDPAGYRDQTTWTLVGAWALTNAEVALTAELRQRRHPNDLDEDEDRWTLAAEVEGRWPEAVVWTAFAELEEARFPNDPDENATETAFGLEVAFPF